jgi:hypothetical protein
MQAGSKMEDLIQACSKSQFCCALLVVLVLLVAMCVLKKKSRALAIQGSHPQHPQAQEPEGQGWAKQCLNNLLLVIF